MLRPVGSFNLCLFLAFPIVHEQFVCAGIAFAACVREVGAGCDEDAVLTRVAFPVPAWGGRSFEEPEFVPVAAEETPGRSGV